MIKTLVLAAIAFVVIYGVAAYGPQYVPALRSMNLPAVPALTNIPFLANIKLPSNVSLPATEQFQPVINSAIATAQQRLPGATEKTSQVLGAQTGATLQSLPNQAFEYARYEYCKQVVNTYEKKD